MALKYYSLLLNAINESIVRSIWNEKGQMGMKSQKRKTQCVIIAGEN
jgi:hypothetical protein